MQARTSTQTFFMIGVKCPKLWFTRRFFHKNTKIQFVWFVCIKILIRDTLWNKVPCADTSVCLLFLFFKNACVNPLVFPVHQVSKYSTYKSNAATLYDCERSLMDKDGKKIQTSFFGFLIFERSTNQNSWGEILSFFKRKLIALKKKWSTCFFWPRQHITT